MLELQGEFLVCVIKGPVADHDMLSDLCEQLCWEHSDVKGATKFVCAMGVRARDVTALFVI